MRKELKVAIISMVSIVLVVAIIIGAVWFFGRSTDPVSVVPASWHITSGDFNSQSYEGYVTADNLQTVTLSSTQTVTQVMVKEGQRVAKGDALLKYDTTLTDIQLERQNLAVQQAQLRVEQAKKDLNRINAMKPYTGPPATRATTAPTTASLTPETEPLLLSGDGTESKPFRVLWIEGSKPYDDLINQYLGTKNEVWITVEMRESNSRYGELLSAIGIHVQRVKAQTPATDATDETSETSETTAPSNTGTLSYSFFVPTITDLTPDPTPTPTETEWVDTSSGYTAAEIAAMKLEKQREIRDLDLEWRKAQVQYRRMQEEAQGGTLKATVDGVVTHLGDQQTDVDTGTPFLVVSGGGCYYVKFDIGEYDRDLYPVGSEVQIQSWTTGESLTGVIESIAQTPSSGQYWGSGNPNVTLYQATVSVSGDAMLTVNDYVSVQLQGAGSDSALYLENMYIRSDSTGSYIMKEDENGKLVKTYVRTGGTLWNSYTAVYDGLSEEDWIAFPYGKQVKEGAKTVHDEDGNVG